MTRGEVEGLPQRTRTEETNGEREYVAAIDWRIGMRDSEKPFIRTVSLLCWRLRGSRLSVAHESEDVAVMMNSNSTARMIVVAGELIAVACGGVEVKEFSDLEVMDYYY